MSSPSDWVIELNCVARGIRVDRQSGTITADTAPDELIEISRRCLLCYWKEDQRGGFTPADTTARLTTIPDEVVVRASGGRAVYRHTIIDEKIARWFAE
jgi:hypothetical protein